MGMMSRHPRLQDTRRMSLGPLQVLIVNFDETNFSGEIEAEMRRLEEAGTLRVRGHPRRGQEPTRARSRWSAPQAEIAQALLGDGPTEDRELTSDEWAVADAVEPGGAAAIVILEHTWAIPLREAIEARGRPPRRDRVGDSRGARGTGRRAHRLIQRSAIVAPPVVVTTSTAATATNHVSIANPIPITPYCAAEEASACGM